MPDPRIEIGDLQFVGRLEMEKAPVRQLFFGYAALRRINWSRFAGAGKVAGFRWARRAGSNGRPSWVILIIA